jgi:type IV pilus assembly protein PilB
MNTNEISIRTSLIPGAYGESIVMRILDPRSIQVDIEDLGMTPALYKVVNEEIAKPFGLILLTGPTGSGKTTTLYAFLRRIKSTETKTITIEEPIEYHLEGITQTQVEKNYTFAEGLRAALRQDPDIIMVGEIRDAETATTAVQAAQTGHLVFSTLHTNSAGGVIPRLIDLGVNPKTLPSALRLSIAQRLVRKLCTTCASTRPASPEETTLIDRVMTKARENKKDVSTVPLVGPYTVPQAVGCEKCNKTGYKGRIGIFEAIRMDEAIEKMLSTSMSEREITTTAIPQGILSIQEDAIVKVLHNVTSLEEVLGVVDFG